MKRKFEPLEFSRAALKHLKGIKSDDPSVKLVQETAVLKGNTVEAEVIDFTKLRKEALEAKVKEMQENDEAADAFLRRFRDNEEPKNRVEELSFDVLNNWQELIACNIQRPYLEYLRKALVDIEEDVFADGKGAS